MPNWCSNTLIVEGSPKQLSKLLKHIELTESEAKALGYEEGKKFSCHRVIPRPADQEDNWYAWNNSNWGTKWDLTDLSFFQDDWEEGMVGMTFETAWSPIVAVIDELATQYPKLKFEYTFYEGGSDFWGKYLYNKGRITLEEGGELSKASCEIRMELEGDAHHWCSDCGDSFSCQEENTPIQCEECLATDDETDTELWDTTTEQESANETTYATAG